MEKVIIIGTGPAGYTAAIYSARANLKPVIIAGNQPGGQLTTTTEVENFPGFPKGVDGFELMMNMQQQAERFEAEIQHDFVESVIVNQDGTKTLKLQNGSEMQCHALIIATGASPKMIGLESEQTFFNKGVSTCATCDGAFFRDVPIVVVGGGDSAAEEAIFLTRFASKVHLVHRRDSLRASQIMSDRVVNHEKVQMHWNTEVEEILGDEKVTGIRLKNNQSGDVSDLDCGAVFVAIGHTPNTQSFIGTLKTDDNGYLLKDPASSKTDIEGVFVAGDCSDHVYRQAITASGMGCMAAIDAERWLESKNL